MRGGSMTLPPGLLGKREQEGTQEVQDDIERERAEWIGH